MNAVAVTLGQEFSGYARQAEAGIERVRLPAQPRRTGIAEVRTAANHLGARLACRDCSPGGASPV